MEIEWTVLIAGWWIGSLMIAYGLGLRSQANDGGDDA